MKTATSILILLLLAAPAAFCMNPDGPIGTKWIEPTFDWTSGEFGLEVTRAAAPSESLRYTTTETSKIGGGFEYGYVYSERLTIKASFKFSFNRFDINYASEESTPRSLHLGFRYYLRSGK